MTKIVILTEEEARTLKECLKRGKQEFQKDLDLVKWHQQPGREAYENGLIDLENIRKQLEA